MGNFRFFFPIGRAGGADVVSSPEALESTLIVAGPELGIELGMEPGFGLDRTNGETDTIKYSIGLFICIVLKNQYTVPSLWCIVLH